MFKISYLFKNDFSKILKFIYYIDSLLNINYRHYAIKDIENQINQSTKQL